MPNLPPAQVPDPLSLPRPRLFTTSFGALLTATFLAYGGNFLIQPVLPLIVLQLGGDAALVGAIVAAYSFPSILLRPVLARWADQRSLHATWWIGAGLLAVVDLLYLIPSLLAMFLVRMVHGASWAAFNVGGHATVAASAPKERRGEATSVYNLVIGIAQLALPGIGLIAYATNSWAPLLAASVMSLLAFVLIRYGPVPVVRSSGRPAAAPSAGRASLLEPGAVLPMLIEFLYSSPVTLFITFLPVFAVERHIPLTDLAVFFPIYGVVFVGSRLGLAPYVDRIGRRTLLAVSTASGLIGMLIGVVSGDLTGLIIAGVFYAFGAAQETPAAMALAIDRSDPSRMGSAMATYSIGYQGALGVGAAVLGLVIDSFGFPAAFATGAALLVLLAVLLALNWSQIPSAPRRTSQPA